MYLLKPGEVIMIGSEAFSAMQEIIRCTVSDAVRTGINQALEDMNPSSDWLNPEETKKLLGIRSKSKLQKLRDTGKIVFSQEQGGRVIRYSRKSILKYLEKNKIG